MVLYVGNFQKFSFQWCHVFKKTYFIFSKPAAEEISKSHYLLYLDFADMRAFDAMEMAKKAKQLEKQRRKMTDEERVRTERLEAAEKRSRDADAARVALLKDAIKVKMRSERDMIRNEQEFNRKR